MIQTIISFLSAILIIYTLLCLINILLSWIPGLKFTKFGKVISKICDPYMDIFSKSGFLRIGNIDFSPIVSLGILSTASAILALIQSTGYISLGLILASILTSLWGIISSLLVILTILIFIRWIVLAINKGRTSYDSGWNQVDMILNKFTYKISATFSKTSTSYQKSLLISWITLLFIMIAGKFFIYHLSELCLKIPF